MPSSSEDKSPPSMFRDIVLNNAYQTYPRLSHGNSVKCSSYNEPYSDSSFTPEDTTPASMDNKLQQLKDEILTIRDVYRSLCVDLLLWTDSIVEHKQSLADRLSESASECSSVSYGLDTLLETIPDFREHTYENERFHSVVYENQPVPYKDPAQEELESAYEPVEYPSVPVKKQPKLSVDNGKSSKSAASIMKSASKTAAAPLKETTC